MFKGRTSKYRLKHRKGNMFFHQYTIRHKNRNAVAAVLSEKKISYAIYYPIPLHLQEVYNTGVVKGRFPITEKASEEVLPLPMPAEHVEEQLTFIIQLVLASAKNERGDVEMKQGISHMF